MTQPQDDLKEDFRGQSNLYRPQLGTLSFVPGINEFLAMTAHRLLIVLQHQFSLYCFFDVLLDTFSRFLNVSYSPPNSHFWCCWCILELLEYFSRQLFDLCLKRFWNAMHLNQMVDHESWIKEDQHIPFEPKNYIIAIIGDIS